MTTDVKGYVATTHVVKIVMQQAFRTATRLFRILFDPAQSAPADGGEVQPR
jgi:hypothetical protein